MSKRRNAIHQDTINNVLDKVSYMREELVAIERSLERIQAAKPERRKDTFNNSGKAETKATSLILRRRTTVSRLRGSLHDPLRVK